MDSVFRPDRHGMTGVWLVQVAACVLSILAAAGPSRADTAAEARTLRGHTAGVTSVVFAPDGRTIASGSFDQTVKLWDVASGRDLRTFKGHTDDVFSVVFSPDGRTIVSGGNDRTIRLWDVASGRAMRTFEGHTDNVFSVAVAPDGRTIASGSGDKTIKLWDAAGGVRPRTLRGRHSETVAAVAFSPDGRTIASGSWDETVMLWDAAGGQVLRTLRGHTNGVVSVVFSPDGQTVASAESNGTVKLWDVASGRDLRTLTRDSPDRHSVAVSPDGGVIVSGISDRRDGGADEGTEIVVRDSGSGQDIATLEGHSGSVMALAFSPDGRMIASGSRDKTIRLWDIGSAVDAIEHHQGFEPRPAPAAPTVQASVTPEAVSPVVPGAAVAAMPAGRRVALVVANGGYPDAPLDNPLVDAGLVAASLERAGFAVTIKTDVDLDGFEQALQAFAETARGADLALFYFAGHGFSVASGGLQQNLLMATSANFSAKTTQGLLGGGEPLDHVEAVLSRHARATLIFVDACRNPPRLAERGGGSRGFERIDPATAEGAFIVLSTRQGRIAADGDKGQGSPFARAFASVVPTPGLRIEDAVARIREKVRSETAGDQVPDVVRNDLPEGGVVLMSAVP